MYAVHHHAIQCTSMITQDNGYLCQKVFHGMQKHAKPTFSFYARLFICHQLV